MNAIITGATKGLGLAIAEKFASEGINLAINSRNTKDLQNLKKTFAKKYPNVEVLIKKTDMGKKAQVLAFAKFVLSKWKTIDLLVNNAGVFLPGDIHKEKDGILEAQINTNLYSAYYLTRAIVPKMIKKKKGHVFNMCSVASQIAYPNGGSYSISKFALLGFSKVLREEMKDKGVKVTSILPGATWSNSWAGVDLPESRLMQATDIANATWSAATMSPSAVVEEIILRPQLGDL